MDDRLGNTQVVRLRSAHIGVLATLAMMVASPSGFVAAQNGETCLREQPANTRLFPPELTQFEPYAGNPVFRGTGGETWDELIRERGFVFKDGDQYRLYYTGYRKDRSTAMHMGLATSVDGIHWTRDRRNPLDHAQWTEDVFVLKRDGKYYLFAEGFKDRAHHMTSPDGIRWKEEGTLDIRTTSGEPIEPGPFGTPTVWVENGTWYLFYERGDAAVWLATSKDRRVWRLVQDDPVLKPGPQAYDSQAIAVNQVFRYRGHYYATYHATAHKPWRDWTTNLAVSDDLIHWKKYPGNPVIGGNRSSGIYLREGDRWRLYTMHPQVELFFGKRGGRDR